MSVSSARFAAPRAITSLTPLFRTIGDDQLLRCTQFLERIPDSWQFLEPDVRQRIQGFVTSLPIEGFYDLEFLLAFEPLRQAAEHRVKYASRADLTDVFFFDLPSKIADRFIELYLQSKSFDQANQLAKKLSVYASDLSVDHVRRIVIGAQKNEQVLYSFELGALLSALRARNKLPGNDFDAMLKENQLAEYAPAAPQAS